MVARVKNKATLLPLSLTREIAARKQYFEHSAAPSPRQTLRA
jgi:hypothetical protein